MRVLRILLSRPAFWAVGSSFAFLLATQWKILNYVCGNDPMLYIRAARTLLQPGLYGMEAVREALTFVAPGYTLILALAIAVFGDLAPYWVNTFIWMATVPLMWMVFRALMQSERAALFALTGFWIIAFRGHELHAPYLLYPFRETACFFFTFLSFGLILNGVQGGRNRWPWMLGAFGAILAACGIREPMALMVPGMILGMVCLPVPWVARKRSLVWFVLPWVVIGLVGFFIVATRDITTITQFSVVRYLGNHDVAWSRMQQMWAWFPGRMTWPALILVGIGSIRAFRSAPALLFWFVLPAALMFVFYAYMHMHVRYFLPTILLLAPLAGYGLDGLLQGLERLIRYVVDGRWLRPSITAVVYVLLCAGLVDTWQRIRRWGPPVDRQQVRYWQSLVSNLEPAASGRIEIAVEQRCRYLEDILLSYTDARLLDPKQVSGWPVEASTVHYFKPLSRHAFYATPQWLMYLQVFAHRLIADVMNLQTRSLNPPEIHKLGGGEFESMIASPWTVGPHRQELMMKSGEDQVIWLDWGRSDAEQLKRVSLWSPDDQRELASWELHGNGFQAIYVESHLARSELAWLVVDAPLPVPSRPVVAVKSADEYFSMNLGRDRPLSANAFFADDNKNSREPHAPHLRSDRASAMSFPSIVNASTTGWEIHMDVYEYNTNEALTVYTYRDAEPVLRESVVAEGRRFNFRTGIDEQLALGYQRTDEPDMKISKAISTIGLRLPKQDQP